MANLKKARKVLIPLVIIGMVGAVGLMAASLTSGAGKSHFKRAVKGLVKGVRGEEHSREDRHSEPAKALTHLVVKTEGAVSVTPSNDDTITILATRRAFGSSEEAAQLLDALQWTHAWDGSGRYLIEAKGREGGGLKINGKPFGDGGWVDFAITVPARIRVEVDTEHGAVKVAGMQEARLVTDNGAIEVSDLQGRLEATTDNGRIDARQVGGDARLETDNGRIEAEHVEGRLFAKTDNGAIEAADVGGSAELTTDNGRISARDVGGRLLARTDTGAIDAARVKGGSELQTDHGRITGNGLAGDRVLARATTGSITLEQPGVTGTDYELATEHGRIDLAVPKAASLQVTLSSDHGRLESKLPLRNQLSPGDGDKQLHGTLNQGKHRLLATSETGSITLRPADS